MGQIRKLVGKVTISQYADGECRLDGELDGFPAELTNIRFFLSMLNAGVEALKRHGRYRSRNKVVVPSGIGVICRNGKGLR